MENVKPSATRTSLKTPQTKPVIPATPFAVAATKQAKTVAISALEVLHQLFTTVSSMATALARVARTTTQQPTHARPASLRARNAMALLTSLVSLVTQARFSIRPLTAWTTVTIPLLRAMESMGTLRQQSLLRGRVILTCASSVIPIVQVAMVPKMESVRHAKTDSSCRIALALITVLISSTLTWSSKPVLCAIQIA